MELPFISAFLRKRRFKRTIKQYRQKMQDLLVIANTLDIGFNRITERFHCEKCGQRYCGKNKCKTITPMIIQLQKDYDHWKEQICVIEARYDHDIHF